MTHSRFPSAVPGPGEPGATGRSGWGRETGAGLLALAAVAAGSVLVGLLGGLLWMHLAPRPAFTVVPGGSAQALNAETSAFIAADFWFCVLGVVGGVITGLLGYLLAVRRYGPLPMAGVLGGGLAAAYAASWIGHHAAVTSFLRRIGASKPGTVLHAPVTLGAHSAVVFWPLAAGLVAGGIEMSVVVRARRRALAEQEGAGPDRHGQDSTGRDGGAGPAGYYG
ncbi:MAG TPA: hypothetical protein VGI64_04375 [Streptosporangiaceae bacterium]|jgi:hypothetical protein